MSDLRTFRLLQRAHPERAAIEQLMADERDEVLLGALANPNHSEGRTEGGGAARRGRQESFPDADGAQVEFGADQTFVDALREHAEQEFAFVAARGIQGNAALFDYLSSSPDFPLGGEPQVPQLVGGIALLSLPVLWATAVLSWTRPSRIVLLRPFQSRQVSRGLKRFARKNLAFVGHTFALSDRHVKESFLSLVNWWIPRSLLDLVLIPLFFIPAFRQLLRWVHVRNARSYGFLVTRLSRRRTLNMFWPHSWNKMLRVKCADTWWRQTVDLLMYASQLIVVDVSLVKSGSESGL